MTLRAPADLTSTPFHVLSIEGMPKSGKTDLACKAPGRIAVQSTDHGWDGIIQKHADWETRFLVEDYHVSVDLSADELFKEGARDMAEQMANAQADRVNRETWQPFSQDTKAAFQDPSVRSLVWDQADEFTDYLRLANFGKIERNPQLAYGPVNAEYKGLVRQAHRYHKNLILIHQLAKEYKTVIDPNSGKEKSVETGRWKRRGNESINYLVHSYIRTEYVDPVRDTAGQTVKPGRFLVKILRARLNPTANGEVLESPDWVTLMLFLAPDIDPGAWEDAR